MAADEGEYTRFLPVATRYEEASWVCLLPDDKNAAGGSFYSPGKVARGGWISRRLRSRLGKLPAVHFPQSEYSPQLPKARYAVFQGFTITCCRYISVICCLEHSSLITPPPLPPPPPPPPPLPLPPHHSLTRALGNEQNWSGGDPTQNPLTQHNLRYLASCPTRTSPWPE